MGRHLQPDVWMSFHFIFQPTNSTLLLISTTLQCGFLPMQRVSEFLPQEDVPPAVAVQITDLHIPETAHE